MHGIAPPPYYVFKQTLFFSTRRGHYDHDHVNPRCQLRTAREFTFMGKTKNSRFKLTPCFLAFFSTFCQARLQAPAGFFVRKGMRANAHPQGFPFICLAYHKSADTDDHASFQKRRAHHTFGKRLTHWHRCAKPICV